jgi:uncharacterized membrane protein
MARPAPWTDQRLEVIIGNLLRAGVLLSALVVSAGAIVYLTGHGSSEADYRVFRGEPVELRYVESIWGEAFSLKGLGIIQLGLLLLIATPIARVAFSVFAFAREKDRMYVGFTLAVFAILMYSLLGARM